MLTLNNYLLLASLLLLIPSCKLIKPVADIATNYDPNASFENYLTYSMISNEFSSTPPVLKETIERQISNMLQVRGYKQSAVHPDLLVFYSLFPGSVSLGTVKTNQVGYDKIKIKPDISLSPVRTTLKGGVLVIQLIDARKGITVWHGHASRILEVQSVKQETYIRHKVRSLFDKYDYFAQGFLVSRHKAKHSRKTLPIVILQGKAHVLR